MIDFGTYFISEWPFLAPEQPSLLLRPPTGFAPNETFTETRVNCRSGWECVIRDLTACDAHALKAVVHCSKPGHPTLRLFQHCRW